jgi:hypothetical protein
MYNPFFNIGCCDSILALVSYDSSNLFSTILTEMILLDLKIQSRYLL